MRIFFFVNRSTLFLGLLFSLTACTVLVGASAEETPTPLPTSSISGLQVVAPQACQVAQHGVIRAEKPQGDLVAWSPIADRLAYVASTQGSSWNVGELNLLTAPAFDTPVRFATQVAGELNWSPEGLYLAYLSLRRSDNLFTIGLVSSDGRTTKDLFPGEVARTDGYSSQKAILSWMDEGRLRVLTSCGVDCMQRIDFGILTGLSTPSGDPVQRTWELWSVHTNHPNSLPTAFARLPGQLNWSPDGSRIAYIDGNDNAWVINVEAGSLYPLELSQFGTASETDWSYDSKYLSVRVDQVLHIFAFDCP